MHVPEVGSLLFTFLKQCYEELSISCLKLSENEIQITCLLLEVCVLCLILVDGTFILRLGVNLFHFVCRVVLCHLPLGGNDLQDVYSNYCG